MIGRSAGNRASKDRARKAIKEAAGLLRGPQRLFPLLHRVSADSLRTKFEQRNLYSYTSSEISTTDSLRSVFRWIIEAQREDGGIAAYYSLLTGYAESYPEVTGYLIPTLYDFGLMTGERAAIVAAQRATSWLLSLQMTSGAFPAGLHGDNVQPSVFNTGQILQGLVRAYVESKDQNLLDRAVAAGNWLASVQAANGAWSGTGAYQGVPHTYYTMVSLALVQLSEVSNPSFASVADKNLEWVLPHIKSSGWIDGINLRGHPTYLHFIAYVIQGILECGIPRRRDDLIQAAAMPAWVLLRKFETNKRLLGTYEDDFKGGRRFTCLTGNAQMSCVWLRLFEATGDLRYLNAALKMNELVKEMLPRRGTRGVRGGISGSYPIWGAYQPFRYISWGAKFLADALMLEQRLTRSFETSLCAS